MKLAVIIAESLMLSFSNRKQIFSTLMDHHHFRSHAPASAILNEVLAVSAVQLIDFVLYY